MSRVMAIDFGSHRIGLAVSDPLKIIAQGLKTIANTENSIDEIAALLTEYSVSEIIVGNPLLLSGKESATSEDVVQFVKKLSEKTDIKIVLVDERFTSVLAHKAMIDMGMNRKKRQNKAKVDEIASAILLQGYLDSRKR
ncbi:MAG: Holliday junction resolvase RuvX [Bacteroidota bacterium]